MLACILSLAVLAGLGWMARNWLREREAAVARTLQAEAEFERLLPEWRAEIDRMERGSV